MNSKQWQAAVEAAYHHPSGLLCFKGQIGADYPGYVDQAHVEDCAKITAQILRGMIRNSRFTQRPELLRDNYRTYLFHQTKARRTRLDRITEGELVHYEELRQMYKAHSDHTFLPLACYYDLVGDQRTGEEPWDVMAVFVNATDVDIARRFYETYDRIERLRRMKQRLPHYQQFLLNHADQLKGTYMDIDWQHLDALAQRGVLEMPEAV